MDTLNNKPLSGRVALVTGAARRLGQAIAEDLAARGADIVLHYFSSEPDETCARLAQFGVRLWRIRADLNREDEARRLVSAAADRAGSLDFLVNNAASFNPGTLAEVSFDALIRDLRLNAWAPFVLTREFAAGDRAGAVVNILDTQVAGYDRGHASYILSKHLLARLTEMTALEYAPGVRVNAVAPGPILPPVGQDESYLVRLAAGLPLRRHGSPADVAAAVVYLLASEFVTGQVIYVDGGRHLVKSDRAK